jgi:hypothetical protein
MRLYEFETSDLEEVDRRGFLKGMGAAAVAAATITPAQAERWWSRDELSDKLKSEMNSDNFNGARLYSDENLHAFYINLREPINGSPNNIKANRLYYPKITSDRYAIRFGNNKPFTSMIGSVFSFPVRDFGNYTASGIMLVNRNPKQYEGFMYYFNNEDIDRITVQLEIDGQTTNLVFTPATENQQNQQRKLQRAEQERRFGKGVVTVDVSSNGTIVTYTDKSQLILDKSGNLIKILGPDGREEKLPTKESVSQGVAEGSEDPFGPQGRYVGDTGPAQITATVRQVPLRAGDRVIYKPTEQRATIEALSRDGTKARIHVPSPMGGRTFNCEVADLRAIGRGSLEEKSTSQAQFRTMAAAAHDPAFARKVGIKQSVAKEFNKADKGQSYKSLPKRAD